MPRSLFTLIATVCIANGISMDLHATPPPASITPGDQRSPTLLGRARAALWDVLRQDRSWVGIHAAEALVARGDGEAVRAFLDQSGRELPRVGQLRVRAQIAVGAERQDVIAAIEAIFLDPAAPDRKQAIESLAKLRVTLGSAARAQAAAQAEHAPIEERILPWWSLHHSGDTAAAGHLVQALQSDTPLARQRAGYAWRWIGTQDPAVRQAIAAAAEREPRGTLPCAFLVSSALHLHADASRESTWRQELFALLETGPSAAAYEAGQILGPWIRSDDIPKLTRLLEHPDGDVRIAAALLLLHGQSSQNP